MVPVAVSVSCQPSQQASISMGSFGKSSVSHTCSFIRVLPPAPLADSEGHVVSICINKTFCNSLR